MTACNYTQTHHQQLDSVASFKDSGSATNGPKIYQRKKMAFRELYPIVIASLLWGHLWTSKRILFYCDNEATVKIIHKGRSKSLCIIKLMRQLTWCSAQFNLCIYSKHLPGKTNRIADALSRFQMAKFRRLAPAAVTANLSLAFPWRKFFGHFK